MDIAPQFWSLAWRMHGKLLPLLHMGDQARTSDLDNSLKVLWCKALVGLDKTSPVYDDGLAYDMLPSQSRWIVLLPERFFPRLVHFIIELRTAYLDRALQEEMKHAQRTYATKTPKDALPLCRIRLITLGAGYDTRSVKFLNRHHRYHGERQHVDKAYELDMPQVIKSKSIMLDRLQARRSTTRVPRLISQDLTDFDGLQKELSRILHCNDDDDNNKSEEWHTIFLVEGVLIYLPEQDRSRVLFVCSEVLQRKNLHGSILFADRIRKLRDPDFMQVQKWLESDGWELVNGSFCVHPGKARHMGAARVN
jgi:O-methyltransferase involved in polyketide biosynthesis